MDWPQVSRKELLSKTLVVVLVFAALQYFGIFQDDGIDWLFLATLAVSFPVVTFLVELLAENVSSGAQNAS